MTQTGIVAEPGQPQIVITRDFRAPRDLLFRAHTDPDLLVQWLGPRTVRMTVDRLDARDGGIWRYTHRQPGGEAHAFHGVYHGTPSPDGIVSTFEYERAPGHVSLNTITFEEHDGTTTLRQNTVFQSVADRDGYVESGMEEGVRDSMQRLDELLAAQATAGRTTAAITTAGRISPGNKGE
jgi:uncharacterized protein YndB with AHSA1/START domain